MNRFLFALIFLSFIYTSCSKEVKPLTKEQIEFRIDSIFNERKKEAAIRAQKELDHRIKIEVKIKADSIFNARQAQQLTLDTTQKPNTPN